MYSNATVTSEIDPNDSRLTEAILNVHIPGPPTSRFASHYLSLTGDDAGAERRDKCGRFRDLKDKNNHTKREYRHCMDGMCRYCATKLAKSTYERWERTLQMIETAGETLPISITYLEVTLPLPRTRAAAEKLLSDSCHLVEKGWIYFAGYRGPNAVLRILSVDQEPRTQCDKHYVTGWVEQFPASASVSVNIMPVSHLRMTFRDRLLSTSLCLADSYDRAEQSAIFSGMRRLRKRGIQILPKTEERELFAGENTTANNSSEDLATLEDTLPPVAHHSHDICPRCGEIFDEETQWFAPDAIEPRPGERLWFPRRVKNPPGS